MPINTLWLSTSCMFVLKWGSAILLRSHRWQYVFSANFNRISSQLISILKIYVKNKFISFQLSNSAFVPMWTQCRKSNNSRTQIKANRETENDNVHTTCAIGTIIYNIWILNWFIHKIVTKYFIYTPANSVSEQKELLPIKAFFIWFT